MNHVHGLHAQTNTTLRAIMADDQPPAERLYMMASQLNGKLEAGNLRRLPVCELVDLRGLVFAIHAVADQIVAEEQARRVVVPRRRWWRVWG